MLKLLDLEQRIAAGESETLEFKKSTGQLNRAGDMLSGPHRSVLRNPLIAEVFHRTGGVEIWGAAPTGSSRRARSTGSIRRPSRSMLAR